MLSIILASVVTLSAVVEVGRNLLQRSTTLKDEELISEASLYVKALPVAEWGDYGEDEKSMVRVAMEKINKRNAAVPRCWMELTKEEQVVIEHSQRFSEGMDKLVKFLVDRECGVSHA